MTFSQALTAMQGGSKTARAVWTGGMYISMVFPPADPVTGPKPVYVFIFTGSSAVPWIPTVADINATDWATVP